MTIEEHIKYWLSSSRIDFDAAENIFKAHNYHWSLFIAHISIEKLLKAFWVRNNNNEMPPKTHNLLKLAETAKLKLSEEEKELLIDVTSFNIEARYPDLKLDFYEKCDKTFAEDYLRKIRGFYKCMIEKL